MPVSDPIADMLTRIRNAQHARDTSCACPWSRHKEEICMVLRREGYLADVAVTGEGKDKTIAVTFLPEKPPLTLKRISTPGRRVYMGQSDLKPVLRGYGMAIISTSAGLMTNSEAKKRGIGGEILCTVS